MFFEFENPTNTIVNLEDIQYAYKADGTHNNIMNIMIKLNKYDNMLYVSYDDIKTRDRDYELLKQELLPKRHTPFISYLFTKDYNSDRGFTIYAGHIGEVKRVETHTTKSDVVIVDGEVIFEIGSANAKKYGRPIYK